MKEQPGVRLRCSRIVVGTGIPNRRSIGRAVPLTNVVETHPIIQGKLPVRLIRILGVNRPLVEFKIVCWDYVLLLVVAVHAQKEVSNRVSRVIRSPSYVVIALVSQL